MMTELDKSFSGFGGAIKYFVNNNNNTYTRFTSLKNINPWDMMLYGHMKN